MTGVNLAVEGVGVGALVELLEAREEAGPTG